MDFNLYPMRENRRVNREMSPVEIGILGVIVLFILMFLLGAVSHYHIIP